MRNSIFKTAMVLSAVDKMTTVVNRAFGNAERRFSSLAKKSNQYAKTAAKVGKKAAIIGTVIAAPLVLATKKAIEFEESMADVSKVMDMKRGSAELMAMSQQTKDLSVHLAKAPGDAANLVASLAQGGTAKKELMQVARFAGEMAVAFDIAGQSAGDAFSKTKNALQATTKETMAVMDAINHLSDNEAAKASQVMTFMAQGGAAAARQMKMTGQESAAIGATFIAMGKTGSEAGTIVARMTRHLNKNNEAGKIFRSAGGGMAGVMAVLKAGNAMGDMKQAAFFDKFGLYGAQIRNMANSMEQLKTNSDRVKLPGNFAGSIGREFANRSDTRAFEIRKMQSQLIATGIDVGNVLLPVISELFKAISPMLKSLSAWIAKNPDLTASIVKGAAAMAALSFIVSGLSFAFSGVFKVVSLMSRGFAFASRAGRILTVMFSRKMGIFRIFSSVGLKIARVLKLVRTGILLVGRAMVANPIGVIIMAIAGAAYLLWKYWEPISGYFSGMFEKIITGFGQLREYLGQVKAVFKAAGSNIVKSIWEGIKGMANKPVEAIKNMVQKMRNYLPFSPAKVGPFKDLHRVKIVETIAQSIRPAAAVNAMKNTVGSLASIGVSNNGGSGGRSDIIINFQPEINMGSDPGSNKEDILTTLRMYSGELLRLIADAENNRNRTAF